MGLVCRVEIRPIFSLAAEEQSFYSPTGLF